MRREAMVNLLTKNGLTKTTDVLCASSIKEVYVMLGFACNIRCPICPFWGTTGVSHGGADAKYHDDFDAAAMERFLSGIRSYGARYLNVSGGEPLAFPHWIDVAKMGRRAGFHVTLSTNGSLLHRHLDLVRDHVDTLQLSFTDPDEWRRGFRTEDWATELERLFTELKKKPGFTIHVNYAITDESVGELASITEVLRGRMPIDGYRIGHPMFLSPELLLAHRAGLRELGTDGAFWNGFGTVPRSIDPERLVTTLRSLRARWPDIVVFPEIEEAEVPAYYRDPRSLPERFRGSCGAPWTQVNVVPNGDVWVCYDVPLGNIKRDDADAIWNGPAVRALRERILDRGLFAGCRGCFNKYSGLEQRTAPPGSRAAQ
jgi:MoaA/NifB/PqqE/SkfB family radical SAM enzyme